VSHGVLGTNGVTLERSSWCHYFAILEADGISGEKYSLPFNLVYWDQMV
jgi:hypothetical protein